MSVRIFEWTLDKICRTCAPNIHPSVPALKNKHPHDDNMDNWLNVCVYVMKKVKYYCSTEAVSAFIFEIYRCKHRHLLMSAVYIGQWINCIRSAFNHLNSLSNTEATIFNLGGEWEIYCANNTCRTVGDVSISFSFGSKLIPSSVYYNRGPAIDTHTTHHEQTNRFKWEYMLHVINFSFS